MGSAVKSIATIALVAFAPAIGSYAFAYGVSAGLAVTTAGLLAVGAVAITALAGASIAGSAYSFDAPDVPTVDNYAGQKIKNQKTNTAPVPILFGNHRQGGNIIFQYANDEINNSNDERGYNRDYWGIIVVAGHEIDDVNAIYADEVSLDSLGSNIYGKVHEQVKWYATSGDSGIALSDVYFPTNETGSTQTGSSLNLQVVTTNSTDEVLTFSGNVDHELYIEFDCAVSGGATYSGSGTSGTLESGVSSAGGYYNEYGEGWHGDLSATISYSAIDTATLTSGRSYKIQLRDTSGRGNISVNQQPTQANGYRAKVYISDGDGGEGSYAFDVDFLEQTITGASDVTIPANVSYLAVHQVFDGKHNHNTALGNISVDLDGKKIRTFTNSSTISTTKTYSTNPAEIVYDIMNDALAVQPDEIDIESFYNAKVACNNAGWSCNIALIQQSNIQSTIQDVLSTCRGSIYHSNGTWKLKIDTKSQSVVRTLNDDDIIDNSLNISMKGSRDIANKIILKYVNPDDQWLSAQVEFEAGQLINLDNQLLEKKLDVKGVTNTTQANKLAQITLNAMRYTQDASGNRLNQTPLACSFATTVKNADLEVGDVITINHDILDRDRNFVILSIETDQSGLIQISTREHCETHYKDTSGNYLI